MNKQGLSIAYFLSGQKYVLIATTDIGEFHCRKVTKLHSLQLSAVKVTVVMCVHRDMNLKNTFVKRGTAFVRLSLGKCNWGHGFVKRGNAFVKVDIAIV
jgi:hypothetical protein